MHTPDAGSQVVKIVVVNNLPKTNLVTKEGHQTPYFLLELNPILGKIINTPTSIQIVEVKMGEDKNTSPSVILKTPTMN